MKSLLAAPTPPSLADPQEVVVGPGLIPFLSGTRQNPTKTQSRPLISGIHIFADP